MKIAIIGTGFIVPYALDAMQQVKGIEVTSIFAREKSLKKGKELSKQFNIPNIYTDYQQLLQEDTCDFVYIANINAVHYDYTKQALQANKNVILEKPSTTSAKETKELTQLAQDKGLYLFEAVTAIHNPNYHEIKKRIPDVGNIRLIQANYSQYSSRYDPYKEGNVLPALNPELYGGALYDINIYNINVIVSLFGKPIALQYIANKGFNGVDTSGTICMQYDGFYCIATGAKDSNSNGFVTIQGDMGTLSEKGSTNLFQEFSFYDTHTKETQTFNFNPASNRMVYEFEEFLDVYNQKDYKKMKEWLQTSIDVMEVVDQAVQSAHLKFGK